MKKLLTMVVILSAASLSLAQEPYRLAPVTSPVIITYGDGQSKPVTIQTAPAPVTVGEPCKTTACVTEPKKNTKTVYSSVCKEYCVMNCSPFSFFGSSDCGCCDNCEKRTKNVLVKKKVPTCDTTQCVLKEVPTGGCAPCGK